MYVREATNKDYVAIEEIIRDSTDTTVALSIGLKGAQKIKEFYNKEYFKALEKIFVAEEDNKLIGCVAITDNNEGKMLYVLNGFKGHKAAKLLVEEALNYARNKGNSFLEAEALDTTVTFLEKMGGKHIVSGEQNIRGEKIKVHRILFKL